MSLIVPANTFWEKVFEGLEAMFKTTHRQAWWVCDANMTRAWCTVPAPFSKKGAERSKELDEYRSYEVPALVYEYQETRATSVLFQGWCGALVILKARAWWWHVDRIRLE